MEKLNGLVTKSLSGTYTVLLPDDRMFTCRPRGKFRKDGISPMVGDRVLITAEPDMGSGLDEGVLEEILPRKNQLIRPPLSNLDILAEVISVTDPAPNYLVIDKVIAISELAGIEPVIVITKTDLGRSDSLFDIYKRAGFSVFLHSENQGGDINGLTDKLKGKMSAFIGNTGVGKSTLLNKILPDARLLTGEISKKLGRGRHTTRHVELYRMGDAFIADTPGFSMVDIVQYSVFDKTQLYLGFREFLPFIGDCKFTSCSHTKEQGCAVLAALNKGEIPASRHGSYVAIYNELKELNEWELPDRVNKKLK